MTWQTEELIRAHKYSSNNKPYLKKDKVCGCFNCYKIFSPDKINAYIEKDNDCDREGTAFCPYCYMDTVIGESSGFPITDEFLKSMNRYWMKSRRGIALSTPFGKVKLQLDGVDQWFDYRCIGRDSVCPDVDGTYHIRYDYVSDGKEHTLRFILVDSPVKGDPESGERLEENSFYIGEGKISLGCYADFFDWDHIDFDFDGNLIHNGLEIYILSTTESQTFKFGVSWLLKCTEENESQTWYEADPGSL